jgi:CelD/BcsL family acetyltransferase involved in cellulose biosynthesis
MVGPGRDPEVHAPAAAASKSSRGASPADEGRVAADARPEFLDPIADSRWRRFVESQPSATAFHHPSWMQLLQRQYGYRFSAACVTCERGQIVCGLPIATVASRLTGRRLVSLPFSDACEALGIDDAPAATTLGRTIAAEVARQRLGLEIRATAPMVPSAQSIPLFFQHRLALTADVETGYRSQISRGAAKARRAGLRVERRTDDDALLRYYGLHTGTRRRQGVPTQPKRFIRRFAELFARGLGFVMLVRDGTAVTAGAVFLTWNRTVTYKYGASDPGHLRSRPNNLLFVEAIRSAYEDGYEVLDFGRTDRSNDGLRAFKRAFGASESDLSYTYVGRAPPAADPSLSARALNWTIRRGPPSLSRLIGEALYRHAG